MKRYYNATTKEWYNEGQTLTRKTKDGVFAGIPSVELLLEWGFEEWHEPEPTQEELLARAKDIKISEIESYDNSEEVNSFTINGIKGWLDRNTRVALLNALNVVEDLGEEDYSVWFEGVSMTLPISVIKKFLNNLELYAIAALNVTNRHIFEVKNMTSLEDVEAFDITKGYPEKLDVIINK